MTGSLSRPDSAAAAAAAGWDGDAYALITNGDDLALVWYTVWDSDADAREYIDAYRRAFAARFVGVGADAPLTANDRQAQIDRLTISGCEYLKL